MQEFNAFKQAKLAEIKNDAAKLEGYKSLADEHNATILNARHSFITDDRARNFVVDRNINVIEDAIRILGAVDHYKSLLMIRTPRLRGSSVNIQHAGIRKK
jgi:hypothetical protein